MSETIIKVEGLYKQYKLGEIGTGSLNADLNRWWHKVRGKENPYLKIGEANDRATKGSSDYVWALQDINFEVKQGEVLGIIGRNGAGKSTLLKILSKTTAPSKGAVKIKGRIASLLEVGTGFHPDLSGRDNIYLNGAILGMTKKEITSKFDEIVDFSGVERYIDTPVKRYSSGMYVRLAFAVAAHLEPEILIVDEVLAVGDAEFQKKCLGKMQDVSVNDGRTVLFVSHTMSAIKQLCKRSILLSKGGVEKDGSTADVINHYLSSNNTTNLTSIEFAPSNKKVYLASLAIKDESADIVDTLKSEDDFYIHSSFVSNEDIDHVEVSICLKNSNGIALLFTSLSDFFTGNLLTLAKGSYTTKTKIRKNFLLPDNYTIDIYIHQRNVQNIDFYENVLQFSIIDVGTTMAPYGKAAADFCCVLDNCEWEIKKANN